MWEKAVFSLLLISDGCEMLLLLMAAINVFFFFFIYNNVLNSNVKTRLLTSPLMSPPQMKPESVQK